MTDDADVSAEVLDRVRAACLRLPQVREEQAWVGTRWRVRSRTFAHVLAVADGWPPAYASAAGTDGPITLLTFRSSGPELDALGDAGPRYFRPPWGPDVVGVVLDEWTDWAEVEELLTESYCLLAPQRLAALVDGPGAVRSSRHRGGTMSETADETHTHHAIDYVEIAVTDIEAAKAFYTSAFGWSMVDYGPEYVGIQAGGREQGGLRLDSSVRQGGPLVILYSGDLEASAEAVTAAGGRILQAIYAFPGGRRFHFADPSGNELAVWSDR